MKKLWQGNFPALLSLLLFFHVVENPVPRDEEAGDDHIGEQPGTEKCAGEDEFVVHPHHPPMSAVTVSAQVSTVVRMLSSE